MPNKIAKHSGISLAVMASAIIVLGGVMNAAYAQTLTIQTDKDSYNAGDEITVTGKLTAPTINQPILIRVFDPDGNFVRSEILDAAADGSYSYTFTSGGPLMAKSGTYTVQATYAGSVNQETTFEFVGGEGGSGGWRTIQAKIGGQDHPIQYMITGSGNRLISITGDVDTATLVARLSTASDGTLSLRFNASTFDATDEFAAFADEIPTTVEDESEGSVNTIHIDFELGTEEVEIVGDSIIPEFGAIAAIILAVAIVGIIVATARYGKLSSFVRKDW